MTVKLSRKITRKARIILGLMFQYARIIFYKVISTVSMEGRATLHQPLLTQGEGVVKISNNVNIGVRTSPSFFSSYAYIESRNLNATITIGNNCWINNNFTMIAESSLISIGDNCLIGSNVEIYDSDFHALNYKDRGQGNSEDRSKPVIIEKNVFIGSNVKIMKGVKIGLGAVIAHGSIVVSDVESMTVFGGSPARMLKKIE